MMQDEPHDKAFQAWLKENRTIACPTCGQGLQKQEGCNHLQYASMLCHVTSLHITHTLQTVASPAVQMLIDSCTA